MAFSFIFYSSINKTLIFSSFTSLPIMFTMPHPIITFTGSDLFYIKYIFPGDPPTPHKNKKGKSFPERKLLPS